MLLRDIIDIIESAAPLSAQCEWDNSGLQIGHLDDDVTSVLLSTDVTEDILREAIERHSQLIISHHPLFFHGLKTLQGHSPQQRITETAIRHGIAVYSSHTAMDMQPDGVSGYAASLIGLQNRTILSPYGAETGLGVIGNLPAKISFKHLLNTLSTVFKQPYIRYTLGASRDVEQIVQRIAFVGGAGAECIPDAIEHGADAFISADFRHHDFTDWADTIPLIDIGHFESEQFTKDIFRRLLESCPLTITDATADVSPIKILKI
mgnify:CR=1 FL=1